MLAFAAAAGLYLVALAALTIGQRKLMYFPYAREVAPASVGLPDAKTFYLKTDDGETLLAWLIPPLPGKSLILYFHGNANSLGQLGPRFRKLKETGDGILAVEYRGYAGSTGTPTEDGLLRDGAATYEKAIALGFAPQRLVAMGESLGSGVAVDLASRKPVGAVVLDSPYSATVDVAAARYWMFPVRRLMRDQFRSDQKIGKVAAPLLIVHGTADWTIPIRFGEKLFGLANEPKDFIRIEGAGHVEMERVIPEVLTWIDKRTG
jgi:fermentation-respiration switch protein FrsA (DUF1100 family)